MKLAAASLERDLVADFPVSLSQTMQLTHTCTFVLLPFVRTCNWCSVCANLFPRAPRARAWPAAYRAQAWYGWKRRVPARYGCSHTSTISQVKGNYLKTSVGSSQKVWTEKKSAEVRGRIMSILIWHRCPHARHYALINPALAAKCAKEAGASPRAAAAAALHSGTVRWS